MHQKSLYHLIQAGVWTLPVAGLLKLAGQFGTFNSVGFNVNDRQAAQVVAAPGFFLGEFVGSILPVVLGFFAVMAVFVLVANTPGGQWAVAGLISSIVGLALILPALGVLNYAFPVIGRAYLHGEAASFHMADTFFQWPWLAIFFPGLLVPLGTILFAVAIWRSDVLPKWPWMLYAFSTLFVAFPLPIHLLRLIGGVIGVFAGGWVAATVPHYQPGNDNTQQARRPTTGPPV